TSAPSCWPSWAPNTCCACCRGARTNTNVSSARQSWPAGPAARISRWCTPPGCTTTPSVTAAGSTTTCRSTTSRTWRLRAPERGNPGHKLTQRSIRAVLFDLDGTLLDTAPDLIRVLNQVRREQGREPLPYAEVRTQVSHGSSGLIRLGFPDLSGQPLEN